MKDKVLIGIIIVLFLTLFIETAYLFKLKSENEVRAFHGMPQQPQNHFHSFRKIDPFSDFKNIEKLLADTSQLNLSTSLNFGPSFNRFENEKEYIIRGHVPNLSGMISINIENDALIISGEQKTKSEEKHGGFYKMQSSFNSFNKTLPLPPDIKIEEIKTEYKDGDLVIIIPKNTESLGSGKLKYKEL